MHVRPEVLALADHGRGLAVETDADEEGHLLGLGVAKPRVREGRLRDTIDGRGQDDVRLDISFLVSTDDVEVDVAVERIIGEGREGLELARLLEVRVNVLGRKGARIEIRQRARSARVDEDGGLAALVALLQASQDGLVRSLAIRIRAVHGDVVLARQLLQLVMVVQGSDRRHQS